MDFEDVVRERRSVKTYDPGVPIRDQDLRALFELVVLSPSSFNLQNWRFVVVREPAQKKALQAAAWNQPQVGQASATLVVCGKLDAYRDAARIYADTPESVRARVVPMIEGSYADKPVLQRDEAIRGASLAAMTLMLAAHSLGWATGPMIGFDPEQVARVVQLPPGWIPAMLVVIGRMQGEIRPRASRLPVSEVVRLETAVGAGL